MIQYQFKLFAISRSSSNHFQFTWHISIWLIYVFKRAYERIIFPARQNRYIMHATRLYHACPENAVSSALLSTDRLEETNLIFRKLWYRQNLQLNFFSMYETKNPISDFSICIGQSICLQYIDITWLKVNVTLTFMHTLWDYQAGCTATHLLSRCKNWKTRHVLCSPRLPPALILTSPYQYSPRFIGLKWLHFGLN